MPVIARAIAGLLLMLGLVGGAACTPAAAPSPSPTATSPVAKAGDNAAPAAKPAANADWDNLVAAAKKEGKVVISVPAGAGYEGVMAAFQKAFPDIKVDANYQHGADFIPKATAERSGSQYLQDIYIGASTVLELKRLGFLDPLKPVLILPDVLDDSKWMGGGLDAAFMDKDKYDLAFEISVKHPVLVNRDAVPESQMSKIDSILDPKWGDKIDIIDPRGPGSGRDTVGFFLKMRGEEFVRKLLAQPLALTKDYRQLAEWNIRGKNPVSLGLPLYILNDLKKDGLTANIQALDPESDIGTFVSEQNGGMGIMNRAAHPNAAKVFANWLVSRDGQTAWVNNLQESSRRLDVPPGAAIQHPDPKRTYVNMHTEENIHFQSDLDLISKQVIK